MIDVAACAVALRQHLLATLLLMRREFLAEARSGMRTHEGADSLRDGDLEELAGWLSATVMGGAYAAMDNYGTGSTMDRENPALASYRQGRQGDLWNPYRTDDLIIRSRKAGEYVNIFGEKQVSEAREPGFPLEQKGGKYAPQPPSHALETAARWMLEGGRAVEIWRTALDAFNWGDYIVATPD